MSRVISCTCILCAGLPHELVDNGLVYQDVNELIGFIHSDEMLVRPVKLFIVDFISTAVSISLQITFESL